MPPPPSFATEVLAGFCKVTYQFYQTHPFPTTGVWTQNGTTYGDMLTYSNTLITNTLITNLLTLFSNKEAYHFELTTTMVLRAKLLVYLLHYATTTMPIFSSIRLEIGVRWTSSSLSTKWNDWSSYSCGVWTNSLDRGASVLMPLNLAVSVLMPLILWIYTVLFY